MNRQGSQAPPAGDDCPVNLRYAEPFSAAIDLPAIVRSGRRLRRRRSAGVAAGSLAVVGVVVASALGVASIQHGPKAVSAARLNQSAKLRAFPPVAAVSVLGTYADGTPQNWSAIAWISQGGDLCYGAADLAVKAPVPAVSCSTPPSQLLAPGPISLLSKPIFQPMPVKQGAVLAIGFVHGTATKVEVTSRGVTVSASVVALATGDGQSAGAYAVWLPVGPGEGANWSDITNVEVFGADGLRAAQIS